MSYTATMTSRIDVAGRRLIKSVKFVFFMLFLSGLVIITHEVYQSPKYQSFLPLPIQRAVRDIKKTYMDSFSQDLVVFTQTIDAQSLKKKSNRLIRYDNGVAAEVQTKLFEISPLLHSTVTAEVFHTSHIATQMMLAFGGTPEDDLALGVPSFFKTHGMDSGSNYYLETKALYEDTVITVHLSYQLSSAELKIANGPGYDALMTKLAQRYLETALVIHQKQIGRLKFLAMN